MNIAFFVTGLDSGGIENYLLRFLQEKHSKFKTITIICKSATFGELENKYNELYNVELVAKKISYYNLFHLWSLFIFLKEKKYDAICDFTGDMSGLVVFVSFFAKVKTRISFYRSSTNRFKETRLRMIYRALMSFIVKRFSTDILSNSKSAMNNYFKNIWESNNKYEVIYNGINPEKFALVKDDLRIHLSIPAKAFVVGHTGRYNEAKNHSTIIQVALKLCKMQEDIYVLLCGKGVDENLRTIILENNMQNRIIALGYRDDIPRVLNTMDCYYFPSLTEGQPNALLEAMIMNLPIVASNIDPIKECLPESFHTELIDPMKVDDAVGKILNIYTGNQIDKYRHKEWVLRNFDYEQLFDKFYSKLINE